MYGQLIPIGGGDEIPLLKKQLLVGRRESCDIVLRFPNVSAHHCDLFVNEGYWFVRDRNSRNGTKVNGIRVTEKRLDSGDTFSVAKHRFEVRYSPADLGAVGPPPAEDLPSDIMDKPLLERAGLNNEPRSAKRHRSKGEVKRFNVNDDSAGQIESPDKPV
jgi:predicted component of type VI protein secretion system